MPNRSKADTCQEDSCGIETTQCQARNDRHRICHTVLAHAHGGHDRSTEIYQHRTVRMYVLQWQPRDSNGLMGTTDMAGHVLRSTYLRDSRGKRIVQYLISLFCFGSSYLQQGEIFLQDNEVLGWVLVQQLDLMLVRVLARALDVMSAPTSDVVSVLASATRAVLGRALIPHASRVPTQINRQCCPCYHHYHCRGYRTSSAPPSQDAPCVRCRCLLER